MGEITGTGSNAIIAKTKSIFRIFIGVSELTQNLAHFEKKDQLHSLNLSEVIYPEKSRYFNARKLLL